MPSEISNRTKLTFFRELQKLGARLLDRGVGRKAAALTSEVLLRRADRVLSPSFIHDLPQRVVLLLYERNRKNLGQAFQAPVFVGRRKGVWYKDSQSTQRRRELMGEKAPQNFANHVRLDPPFHFFVVPVTALTVVAGLFIW